MGNDERFDFRPTQDEKLRMAETVKEDYRVPENFCQTAPALYGPESKKAKNQAQQSLYYRNPQTTEFCRKLGIFDPNADLLQKHPEREGFPPDNQPAAAGVEVKKNPDEIDLDDDEEEGVVL